VTTLLDAAGGAAVYIKLGSPVSIATLDLRIDYLRPAAARQDVLAHAVCFRLTRNVAFVRGVAYHAESGEEDPIAAAAGAFMLATQAKKP